MRQDVQSEGGFVAGKTAEDLRAHQDRVTAKQQALAEQRAHQERVAAKRRVLYDGIEGLSDLTRLMQNAEKVAERLRIQPKVLDHLYKYSRMPIPSRSDWEWKLRLSASIHAIIIDYWSGSAREIDHVIDHKGVAETLAKLDRPGGMLLLSFHGGYSYLLRYLFYEYFPGGFMITDQGTQKRRELLFRALRTLTDGKTAYVAPDAGLGEQVSQITVLGADCPVALGAALLAYETRCNTAFFFVSRSEAGLALAAKLGPVRKDHETFDAFRDRLNAFYADQIEQVFTGDPMSLVLGGRWTGHFSKMIADRESRPGRVSVWSRRWRREKLWRLRSWIGRNFWS